MLYHKDTYKQSGVNKFLEEEVKCMEENFYDSEELGNSTEVKVI